MTARTYTSPQSFEQRLRSAVSDGAALARKRQLLIFDRFLARATEAFVNPVLAGSHGIWLPDAWAWNSSRRS